jgi:site-specific recombinase XerD
MKKSDSECSFPALLQEFLCQELAAQRNASPRTIASYRDAFRLLLNFTQQHTGKAPIELTFTDLDAPRIVKFLDHLERARHNTIRSRNVRLAALRSFMRYTALHAPMHLAVAQ